jgi:hypothetical protein
MKGEEMGGAFSPHGSVEKCVQNPLSGNLKWRDHSEDLGRTRDYNIRMDLRKIGWKYVKWIHLAQNRDQWWGLVKTVMNKERSFWSAKRKSASRQGLCSIDFVS